MLRTAIDEKQLVKDAKAGKYEAFEALVHRYERKIYNVAYRLSGNRDDAEDVLQETFLKAFENLRRFRGEASFYTWVMRIAVNATLIRFRKSSRPNTITIDELGEGPEGFPPKAIVRWEENPEQKYSRLERERILRRAILRLPPLYRTVFWLRDVEEFSNAEVARMLKVSGFAVKSRLMRARLELREQLTAYFGRKGERSKIQEAAHTHAPG
ncbi:MAG: sigma-70 family RNA polymerase sigma factor [Acidobacteriia bacterium]|nr:sigma-70 family RNA polymerase sigma factor [Terriglobia bacterium]